MMWHKNKGAEKPSEQLADLSRRVHKLVPDHRDPERFHIEKSEIANDLAELADVVR